MKTHLSFLLKFPSVNIRYVNDALAKTHRSSSSLAFPFFLATCRFLLAKKLTASADKKMTLPCDEAAWKELYRAMSEDDKVEWTFQRVQYLLKFRDEILALRKDNETLRGTVNFMYSRCQRLELVAERYKSERDSARLENHLAEEVIRHNHAISEQFRKDRNTYRQAYEELWEEIAEHESHKRPAPTTGTPECPRKKK